MHHRNIALLLTLAAQLANAQTVEGFIIIGNDRRELHHARATRTDGGKTIHLVLSEAPLPERALFDDIKLFDVRSAQTNQVVELNLNEKSVNWFLSGKDMEGTRSMSQSPNPFPYAIANETVKGKVEAKGDGYEISVTYSAPLEKLVKQRPLTAADAAVALKHPAAKAYLDLDRAIHAGNKAQILANAPAERRAEIEKDFDKMLPMVQMMQPNNIKILKAAQNNNEAILTLTGTQDGKAMTGEATMKLNAGRWTLTDQSWRDAK